MYEVGYSDMKAFREVFRNVTGMLPLEYRKKYNKESSLKKKQKVFAHQESIRQL
jgi:AraC-like DNA-binding protein